MADAADRLSLILFSGTVDKLMAASILTTGAVAMDMEVDLFLTNWGLMAFKKGAPATKMKISKDFEEYGPAMAAAMQAKNVPSWMDTLVQAKELGQVHIHACSMTMELFDMTQTDLEDIVDDVIGVAGFMDRAQSGKISLFV
jgi:peroxiredoxin family protein